MRNSIFVEDARVLAHTICPGNQFILRLHAPKCATTAKPGSFVHLQCSPELAMRRPLSLMRVSAEKGWIEVLYQRVGQGTRLLAERKVDETISCMGPIGTPFSPDPKFRRPILIGGGVGIPPMLFLAEKMRLTPEFHPLVLMGSEAPFPFSPKVSEFLVAGIERGVTASLPLLEDWNIPSRLASLQGYSGCYDGYVTDLARQHLDALDSAQLSEVALFACGPHAMLEATAAISREFNIPAQVCLEEYMACAVGGCAGCTVRISTPDGPAMKRVCVDGPVFRAEEVFCGDTS